jgi:hypothetical protein
MPINRPVKPYAAICALEALHAELGGQILQNKKEATLLAERMKHVEAVLKMLQPGYDVRPIAVRRRKPNPWFKRGTVYRHALDILRGAQGPLTTRQITEQMLAAKGVTNASQRAVRDLITSLLSCLRLHEGKSVRTVSEGMPARWKLI